MRKIGRGNLTLPATATLAQAPAVPGGEFQVNTYTSGLQRYPSASVTPDGGFVVVWTSDVSGGDDNSYSSVQGQRFAPSGALIGSQFQVNT